MYTQLTAVTNPLNVQLFCVSNTVVMRTVKRLPSNNKSISDTGIGKYANMQICQQSVRISSNQNQSKHCMCSPPDFFQHMARANTLAQWSTAPQAIASLPIAGSTPTRCPLNPELPTLTNDYRSEMMMGFHALIANHPVVYSCLWEFACS